MKSTPMQPTRQQLDYLRSIVSAMVDMPDESWALCIEYVTYQQYAKDEYLLHAGDVADWAYFVHRGVLRQFYTTAEGKEFNKSFSLEGEPCGSFRSSLTRKSSRLSIQALEPSQVLQIRFQRLFDLFECDRHWERLGRKAAEYQTLLNEEREAEFLLDDATTRYRRFQEQYPGLEQRVAQYHIASYLGITNVALSRIRKKIMGSINPG
ncbi:MAG: cyclic nucleotide-binding domain-containing protein [Candidatus Latescibacteria bacterium]|nr:cyclic nucleotide-binding domain-containing protein [Candidatus Latescibacterota bacterium]